MTLIVRLLLAASLAIQSLPGLGMQPCAAMAVQAPASAGLVEHADCGCCGPARGETVECPLAAQDYAGCNCADQEREAPKTLPPGPDQRPLQHVLALVPVQVAVLPVKLPSLAMRWVRDDPSYRGSAPSLQSLLCVWLM